MDNPTDLRRRDLLAASGLGIASLVLPRAAAHASGTSIVPQGDEFQPAVDPERPLVLYVDAMNPYSYPGTGTTWFDLSVNRNHVTFAAEATQHPTFVTDAGTGQSWFAFDGNDYFDISLEASKRIANASPYSGSTGYSIEAWVWDAGPGGNDRNIVSGADRFLFVTGSSLWAGGDGTYNDLTWNNFPRNVWKYVAFTYHLIEIDPEANTTSGRARLYVDADQKQEKTTSVNYVRNDKLTVGAHNLATPTSFWNGRIAEVRLYARELSPTEVTERFDATKARYLQAN
jgi:hypothetical protein